MLNPKRQKRLLTAIEEGKITDPNSLAMHQLIQDAQDEVDRMEEISKTFDEKVKTALDDTVKEAKSTIEEEIKNVEVIPGKDGESIIGPPGPQGKSIIGPRGPAGPQGPVGESIPGPAGKDADEGTIIAKIENDLPMLGTSVRDGLELLEGDERLDPKCIQGWEVIQKDIQNLKERPIATPPGGIMGRDLFQDIDISTQLNGVTKTFNIQAVWRIISVDLSSYPYGSCRKNIDYTWTSTQIQFTANIDATTQLAQGQTCILTVVVA